MKYEKFILAMCISIISFSCTLNYSGEAKKFKKKPNFVFKNTNLDRYEGDSLSLRINSGALEIYDTDKVWAGESVSFFKMSGTKEGTQEQIELRGAAGLIKIDEADDKYFLGNGVSFEDVKEKIIISGDAFYWDKSAGLLYGTASGRVKVEKSGEFSLKGSGFIANTLSRKFEFTNSVSGSIETETKNE